MYERVLLPTDGGAAMDEVTAHAADVAARRDATVHVLSVVDDRALPTLDDTMTDDVLAELHDEASTAVQRAAERLRDAGVEVVTEVREGDPAPEVLAAVDRIDADLVVMGTRRESFSESLLGSVSRSVVTNSPVPVLTVGADGD